MQLTFVNIDEIRVPPNRQRQEPAKSHIAELALSIIENGLLHAPVVSEDNTLIAGFCRLQAIRHLHEKGHEFWYNGTPVQPGLVPIIRTHLTDSVDLFQLELEENLRRKNLSMMEQAQAIAQLHAYRQKRNEHQSFVDTAKELTKLAGGSDVTNISSAAVAEAITLAQFAGDPDVEKAHTKGAAIRIAKKKLEQQALAALGVVAGESITSRHELLEGDSREILPDLVKAQFDCIITDPPYGIGADEFGSAGFAGGKHGYKDDEETALAAYRLLAIEGYWLCRDEAHLFAFCDIRMWPRLVTIFSEYNWRVWPTPLIWFKGATAHAPRPDFGPKRGYEAILFASKGDKRVLKTGNDLIIIPAVDWRQKIHPAEKPAALFEELLSWSASPGMRVLDPFCGSGTIFEAAENHGCDAVGIELDPQFANICRARITELRK